MPCTPPAVNQQVLYAENFNWYDAIVTGTYTGSNNADLSVLVDGGSPFTRTNIPHSGQGVQNNKWACEDSDVPEGEVWIRLSDRTTKQPA